ncbi:bifunctional UDP-N-acetylmuramoyl-tripeptide:D-alanyl-D-alanine ligase/alanine racemase [Belliella kenyensis]|uniref:Alanine racemase n=1 Tax=Belliella kenyensis TaxID=1472724 RepID=A0ABV8EIJ3_9BACT|nr:bifunctional UDP-N-acetylmuramoyl-tripeptide:D-alanyl-D-alanine ligase/alanine racemase [Belliella kenyensis]MCH7401404.1 bifunctional UDP-N-acetylmuramoyl-tripeptide:D-alanyl-D-alanine ligase/alanine racemase [Belliella kenyensis]MDN3602847.1 bifunctional UDP-N-acetylmuramoyl-tripeptide:D-alanyl-D-alanine ligase/alanine racemase [Belliella kenyensis]
MIQNLSLANIRKILGEDNVDLTDTDPVIQTIIIDSRSVIQPEHTLFVALRGAKFDGHLFIPSLVEAGVKHFLVRSDYNTPQEIEKDVVLFRASDTKIALQKLSTYMRDQFDRPVLAITGSNGKTIIKEWLGQVLSQKFSVAKSPKSYNSQVGVPLSVFGIEAYHQVAVLEAGISKPKEMQVLENIIKPDIGIFSNIGTAHEEGFASQEQKLKEKSKLFINSKYIIYRKDQREVEGFLTSHFDQEKLIAWSDNPGSDYTLSIKRDSEHTKIILIKPDFGMFTFQVPFFDEASLENIRHVIIGAITLGMKESDIQEGINFLKAVDMRLTLKPGYHQSLIIDDTYNNDLAGLKLALDFMAAQRPKNRKVLIISDLMQVGNVEEVYQEVQKLIIFHEIDLLIGVGQHIHLLKTGLSCEQQYFQDTASLLEGLQEDAFENDLILVTGARIFEFEKVVNKLQQRIHGTTLEINLNALTHNYNFYKTKILPSTKIMVMVKAFAYGGGAIEIANHLQQLKADYLAVAYTDEGVALREQGISLPIMVLNPAQESFHLLQKHELEPVVYSPEFFIQLGKYCRLQHFKMKIHLDLDTGMHRLGFDLSQLGDLKVLTERFPELQVTSLYTHLVGADDVEHEDFSLKQLALFSKMCEQIAGFLGHLPLRHALNSAGIIRYPAYQFDMVRLGIGLYGVEVNGIHDTSLRSISSLKTTISQIKHIEAGETIGYSRRGKLKAAGKIATIAIGYADGYDRRFSNGVGSVMINGQKAPIIGNVCMDMCMVDVSSINAKEGDEVLIYGPGISLKELAKNIGTIPYELLTNISSRVKRVYYLD